MSTINGSTVASINQTPTTPSGSSSANGVTSASDLQNEFMQLLVAQLKNQDPSAPTDSTQFVTQLAQISQLEATQTTNTDLTQIAQSQSAATNASMASLVGKSITASGSTITSNGQTAPSLSVNMAGAASNVEVDILDSSGNTVKKLNLGAMPAGTTAINWQQAGGGTLAGGTYSVQVKASNGKATVNGTPEITGIISSLTFNAGNATFNVGGTSVSPSNILSIDN